MSQSSAPVDKICADCDQLFTIGSSEQAWFSERDMQLPRRCKNCRASRKLQRLVADRQKQQNALNQELVNRTVRVLLGTGADK